ncbi:McrB family protein [Secundilactobacillus muriivasis]
MTPEQLANKLKKAPNIILRGAPGTGKTYLAHQIAANLVTNGATSDYQSFLKTATPEQLKQVGFVQFHPSYDYTDFVAGLRPTTRDGQIGFEAKLGTFGEFCRDARESEQAQLDELSEDVHDNLYKIAYADLAEKIQNEADFTITGQTKRTNKDEPSEYTFTDLKVKDGDITGGKGLAYKNAYNTNYYSLENLKEYRDSDTGWTYGREILNEYLENKIIDEHYDEIVTKKFVFIIDEINRGEISKIFGELFFSIDPEYRGKQGEVTTQYANLLGDNGKFYIPKNVYIIGTMNDIDRSVDTFDFAMRRRFSFVEVLAEDSAKMLTDEAVIARMKRVNDELVSGEIGLTTDYQIGASYFKQLNEKQSTPEELWEEKLKPLFQDYFRGERRSAEMVELLAQAYWGNDDGTDK